MRYNALYHVFHSITTCPQYLSIFRLAWNQRKIVALHLFFFFLPLCVLLAKPCLSGKTTRFFFF